MSAPAVAVVGAGHMGSLHGDKLAQLAAEGVARLAGVYDVDDARARALAEKIGAPVLESLDQLAECADAACVAVPTISHESVALGLLEQGLDLLVEKPIATTREGARRLVESARKGERILQVGHIERFSRALAAVRDVIARPRFIEAHRLGPYPSRATDVGVVLDLMIHDLDLIADWIGEDVDRVDAVGVPVLSQTDDIANARVRFAGGCVANLTASRVSLEPLRKIRLFQSDLYLSVDFVTNKVGVIRREGEPGGPGADGMPQLSSQSYEMDRGDALLIQDRAFVASVATRSPPEVTGEDGTRALDLALRVQESIPPFEEIVG